MYGWNDYRWLQMAAHYKWYYIFQEVIQFYSLLWSYMLIYWVLRMFRV